jgi:hypothetical protein
VRPVQRAVLIAAAVAAVLASGARAAVQASCRPTAEIRQHDEAVFGHCATVTAANALAQRLAASGFRYIDIVKVGARWAVVMPQVPVKHALSIAAEVHKAGFRITFVTG